MVKYQNEFDETKVKKRGVINVTREVLRDLNSLRAYHNEPLNEVIERLLQSMDPKELTERLVAKLRKSRQMMGPGWREELTASHMGFYRRHEVSKALVRRLYEEALKELDEGD